MRSQNLHGGSIRRIMQRIVPLCVLLLLVGCRDETPADHQKYNYYRSELLSTQTSSAAVGSMINAILPDFAQMVLDAPADMVQTSAISYASQDPFGNAVTASGLIVYPTDIPIRGVILGFHGTILSDLEAPSYNMFQLEKIYAFLGYVVILPDYLGFGQSVEHPHPYLHVENTARVSCDMLFAAREYLDRFNISIDYPINVLGYSQGAHAALSFQRMVEERYSDDIKLKRIYAGGGPFDLTATFDYFAKINYSSMPSTLPNVVLGLNYGDKLGLNFQNIFHGALLSNYEKWFNKRYDLLSVNQFIGSYVLSDFMHSDFFTAEHNPDFAKLYASLAANSLIDWTPRTPIELWHTYNDTVVPFINSDNAFKSFKSRGCDVGLYITRGDGHDHIEMYLDCYKEVYEKLK